MLNLLDEAGGEGANRIKGWLFELLFEGKRYGVVKTQFTEIEAGEEDCW